VGKIINVTNAGEGRPAVLTERVRQGFRSGEYLADGPAIDAVEPDETVAYVVTNRKQGIVIRSDTTRHVMPDSRFQTVVVVTDRRVIALVGKVGGDDRFTVDFSDITDVATTRERRTGQLTIERDDGTSWGVHTEADGLTELADYLRRRCAACQAPGRVQSATRSIRGMFQTTFGSGKSFERDQMAKLIPPIDESQSRTGNSDGPDRDATGSAASPPGGRESDAIEQADKPDTETAIDEILQALAKTDWRARGARPESPFDLLAEREDELVGVVVHCPDDDRIEKRTIKQCDAITGAAGTDTVMLATTATIRDTDARLAADLGVRLRNVSTMSDTTDPPTIEAVTEMVGTVLGRAGWSVRPEASGPFDLLADCGDELMGVVVHSPEDGTVRSSIEHCDVVTGAAGTDTVMLATTGTVRDTDERLAEKLGVRLVKSDSLAPRHVTEIADE